MKWPISQISARRVRIKYGSNPYLYARQVKEFKVKYNDNKNIEIISWVELALYGNDETDNYKIKEIEPEQKRTIMRPKYQPIVVEPLTLVNQYLL